jgi:hypothetical protein
MVQDFNGLLTSLPLRELPSLLQFWSSIDYFGIAMMITELMVKGSMFSEILLCFKITNTSPSTSFWVVQDNIGRSANPQIPNRVQESLYRLASNY